MRVAEPTQNQQKGVDGSRPVIRDPGPERLLNCRDPATAFPNRYHGQISSRGPRKVGCVSQEWGVVNALCKRAKPWRQGCPVGEWCCFKKLLRKQAKPTRQGRPVGAAMCRRGSQIPWQHTVGQSPCKIAQHPRDVNEVKKTSKALQTRTSR